MDSQKHKPAGLLDELNSDPDSVPEEDEEKDDDDLQNSQDDDCREEQELLSHLKRLQTAKSTGLQQNYLTFLRGVVRERKTSHSKTVINRRLNCLHKFAHAKRAAMMLLVLQVVFSMLLCIWWCVRWFLISPN